MKLSEHIVNELDPGIKDVVILLNEHGFDTFESCESGEGHSMNDTTVCFWGDEFDCIRAYELCEQLGYYVFRVKRVYRKDGSVAPFDTLSDIFPPFCLYYLF
ncbi:hypothetical protein ACFLSP_04420 [Bacteroidota bacterium]